MELRKFGEIPAFEICPKGEWKIKILEFSTKQSTQNIYSFRFIFYDYKKHGNNKVKMKHFKTFNLKISQKWEQSWEVF